MKEKNTSNYTKVIVLVVALIVLGISTTYAYFTSVITGTPSTTTLKAGNLKIETNLDSVSAINNTKIKLIDASAKTTAAEKVTFYVKSTADTTVDAKYYIYLKDISLSKNLYSNYFKWELLQNNEIVGSGTFGNATRTDTATTGEASNVVTTAADIALNTNALTLAKNTSDTVVFRIWLENDNAVNQIDLTEGSFAGRLYLEAVPVSSNN